MELVTHGLLVEVYERSNQQDLATKHCLAIGKMTPVTTTQNYQPLVKVPPIYPASAWNRKKEGYVTVEYDVDELGFVRNPKIVDIVGHDSFAKVSIEAAKKFRYAPRFIDGKASTTTGVQNRFTFSGFD
jgi:TonB family protein